MDQSKDEDEKEGKSTDSVNNLDEIECQDEELKNVPKNIEENLFKGNKRLTEITFVAPKPKIKKKLHAVISELKTLKEVPNNSSTLTSESSKLNTKSIEKEMQTAEFHVNTSITETHLNEENKNLLTDPTCDHLEKSDIMFPLNYSKQYSSSEVSSNVNINKRRLSDTLSESASPKVKYKLSKSVSSYSPSSVLTIEQQDESSIWNSKRIKFGSEFEAAGVENLEVNSETDNNFEANVTAQSDLFIRESDEGANDGSLPDCRFEKPDSIPVAKVDPLMESSTLSDDTQLRNDSDSESVKSAKEKSESENSDYEDLNKESLMGGATELSARPKVKNMRKNIRDIMAEDKLEEDTLAAQKEEQERLHRLQEKRIAMREYMEQQQVERMVAEVAEAAEAVTAAEAVQEVEEAEDSSQAEPIAEVKKEPSEEDDDDVVVLSSEDSDSESKDSEPDEDVTNETKPLMLPLKPKIEIKSEMNSDSETEESESDSDSDVVVLSHSEDEDDTDEDANNCGAHVNDDFNTPDVNERVLVNVGHPDKEEDIFLAPQLASAIKPHQIGGLRFLYDNIVESLEQFKTSNGFGCILAHSMGLGKTLQVVSLTDVFLRHTESKHVLIIVPINTLQNWVTEYNHWLPEEIPTGLPEGTDFRPRKFKVYLLNDGQKTIKARAKVINDWQTQGGVLLMGYEMYRQLSLKKPKKVKKKKRRNANDIVDIEEEDSQKEYLDEMYKALVKPGPDLIICDEGHRIKNAHANISQALKSIRTRRRVVLTGYPLQNNLLEYWCMVDFVRPNYLGTKTEFSNMFERPIQNGQCVDSTPQDVKLMRYRAHVLHALLEGFVQRRGHSVLAATLPSKNEHVILCRLTPIQRKLYTAYMSVLTVNKGMANPLKAFAICCKIWNHPDILYNLVMKRLNEDLDLDLDEVVGKAGTKAKKAISSKVVADKKKGGKQNPRNWNSSESMVPPNGSSGQNTKISDASPTNVPTGFQPNVMASPQMMAQHQNNPQQQRMPMNNTPNEHSNVSMGYSYPNMYNMQSQAPPYMNQMHYPWGYNQGYPPDNNGSYMPPYNMYPQQYPHSMQPNQQEMPSYPMPPSGHISGMPSNNQVCSQPLHDQIITNDHPENQNGAAMNDQQMESIETNSLVKVEESSQMMQMPHMQNSTNNSHIGQNIPNSMNLGQDLRSNVRPHLGMQDLNCKFNYMQSPSSKISEQMNNLALEQKDFNNCNISEDNKQLMQGTLQPTFMQKQEVPNFDRMPDVNEKKELDEEKKDEVKKEEIKKDEVSLEWAESYFKDYVPGLLETSTKFQIFFQILRGSLAVGDRILVFSQSLFTLNQLEEFLQKSVIPETTDEKWAKNRTYFRLDGSTTSQERDKLINEFNNNPLVRLFLVSTRAGSLGINLVGANRVIIFDASFNPCHDTQAVCRVYRYGQTKECHIYRMVTDNSLERRIYDRQVNKQGISDRIVDEMNPEAHLSSKEISNLLVENEEDPTAEDFSDKVDSISDPIFKEIVIDKSHLLTRPPFKHASLLVDRKDKKLSNAEKRLAKRSYELEKQANVSYSRPSYSSFYPKTSGVQNAIGTKIGGILYAKPVGTVRPMQVDARHRIDGGMIHRPNILSRRSNAPVESLAKQGVSVQQITVPKDVSIPTNSGDGKPIQLKGGQSVMVIKTQKGMYLRLSDGKIVAIRIPPGNEDAFGLPLSQGSVTIVPTVFPSRGRNIGAARGGSTIRRGRPPLSAQYALGQVVPKGINKGQMVRIVRKPIASNRGGKTTYQTIAVPVSSQGSVLNKSVVITPAKPGQKMTAKDSKISSKVQITPVPPKAGGLASIGGTSGLNRRLNRNTKLLFQQASGVKQDEFKKTATPAKADDEALQGKNISVNSDSSSDEGDSMSSNDHSPKVTDLSQSLCGNGQIDPVSEDKDKIQSIQPADVAKEENTPIVENQCNLMANSPLPEQNSHIERKINSSEFSLPSKSSFVPITPNNEKSDSMLNPLSQLSNLLPPDERDAQAQMTSTFNTMPQSSQSYSQPIYSNHQLFQPYLQQTVSSSSGTSHAPTQMQMTPSTEAAKQQWSRLPGEMQLNELDSMHGISNLKPQSSFLPPTTSHYQNSSHLESEGNKLPLTSYQKEGNPISQSSTSGLHATEGEKDSNIAINQMLNQPRPPSLPNDSPLSLSNLLPETASADIAVNPSTPLDYMNYSSAFRRVEYPTAEVPSLLHTPTTSEMGAPSAPSYSAPATTPSPSFVGTNPPTYSQYPSYANHNFRAPAMNPPSYPYASQFSPYGHYGGISTQGQPQPPPPTQQYPGVPNQESYNYNSGALPPYTPGLGNFGQGPYPPM